MIKLYAMVSQRQIGFSKRRDCWQTLVRPRSCHANACSLEMHGGFTDTPPFLNKYSNNLPPSWIPMYQSRILGLQFAYASLIC